MTRRSVLAILILAAVLGTFAPFATAQLPAETEAQKAQRLKWWTEARFGMFIHWGLYALPARHEWVKNNERLTNEQYRKYFELFDPDLYNPREWARMARAAGMKYVVLTAKHHEGFCQWDSKFTDYKVTNTPFGRDVIKEYVEAFRAEGLKVGFYYSLIDWHHPDYTVDRMHPQRPANEADYAKLNAGKDMARYREYMKNQVRELLTNYGEISVIWFDFSFPGKNGKGRDDWDSVNLLKLARSLQPGIIVDDRLNLEDVEGGWDFTTPEQVKVAKWPEKNGKRIPWETCQTFSGSWGYYRDETTWKSPAQLIELLAESVSKGGNLLLNVGPTARGTFDERAQASAEGHGRMDEGQRTVDLRLHRGPGRDRGPAEHRPDLEPGDQPALRPLAGLSRSTGSCCPGWPARSNTSSSSTTPPRSGWLRAAAMTAADLVLSLPVLKPAVEIPVLEVFLK